MCKYVTAHTGQYVAGVYDNTELPGRDARRWSGVELYLGDRPDGAPLAPASHWLGQGASCSGLLELL